jgi:tetratricopeptide (TPR) repeat protein
MRCFGMSLMACTFCFIILSPAPSRAQVQSPSQDFFSEGIAQFQSQKLPEAQTAFEKALDQNPNSVAVLFNLGLVHLQEGHKGWAAALWRKALSLQPGMSPARKALDGLSRDLPTPNNDDDGGWIQQFRVLITAQVPWFAWLGGLWITFVFSGWTLARFFGDRQRAKELEQPLPGWPAVSLCSLTLAFLIAIVMTFKWFDDNQPRATVIAGKAALHLTPDAAATTLAEIAPGSEVEILKRYQDWVQVSFGASTNGWIPLSQVFQTSGPAL